MSIYKRSINLELDLDSDVLNEFKISKHAINTISLLLNTVDPDQNERTVVISGSFGSGKSFTLLLYANLIKRSLDDFKLIFPQIFNELNSYKSMNRIFSKKYIKNSSKLIILYGNIDIDKVLYTKLKSQYPKITTGNGSSFQSINLLRSLIVEQNKIGQNLTIIFDEFSMFMEKNKGNLPVEYLQELVELVNNSKYINLYLVTHKLINNYVDQNDTDSLNRWRTIEGRFSSLKLPINTDIMFDILVNALQDKYVSKMRTKFYKDGYRKFTDRKDWIAFSKMNVHLNRIIQKNQIEILWPFHPLAFLSLPILSAEVGQNNRSIASFLNSIENNSLKSLFTFEENEEERNVDFNINLATLWDYFEIPIMQDTGFGGKSDIWQSVNKSLTVILKESTNEQMILLIKSIAIIEICSSILNIYPTDDILTLALTLNGKKNDINFRITVDRLKNLGLIRYHKNRKIWQLYDGTGINWQIEINNIMKNKVFNNANRISTLKKHLKLLPLVTRRHNFKNKIIRFFKQELVLETVDTIIEEDFDEIQILHSDGIIMYLPLLSNEEIIEFHDLDFRVLKIPNNLKRRIIYAIPRKNIDCEEVLRNIFALEILAKNKEFVGLDKRIQNEIDLEIKEQKIILEEKLYDFINSYSNTDFFIPGISTKYCSPNKKELDEELSKLMSITFVHSPIVNSELFNKNIITSTIKREIILLIDEMQQNFTSPLRWDKNPARAVFYRTLTYNTNLSINYEESKLNINASKYNFQDAIVNLSNYISNNHNLTNKEILNFIQSPPYGMRKGSIPIFLYFAMLKSEGNEFFISDSENHLDFLNINGENLVNFVFDTSKEYKMITRLNTDELLQLNASIAEVLLDLIDSETAIYHEIQQSINNNQLSNIKFQQLVQNWFLQLPRFTFRTENLDYIEDEEVLITKNMFRDISIHPIKTLIDFDFIINNISDVNTIINTLRKHIIIINNILPKLKYQIIQSFNSFIGINFSNNKLDEINISEFLGTLKDKFEIMQSVKNFYIADDAQKIENFIQKLSVIHIDQLTIDIIIDNIAKEFTTILPNDWNDMTFQLYESKLKQLKKSISTSNEDKKLNSTIKFISESNEEEFSINFNTDELTNNGKVMLSNLKNQVNIFGRGMTDNEKINVLFKFLKDITNQ